MIILTVQKLSEVNIKVIIVNSYKSGDSEWITTMPDIRIFGEEGSFAEKYANNYHIRFIVNESAEIRTGDFEEKEYENLRYAI